MLKPTALTAHLGWCTGVGRTLKGAEAVAIGEAVFRTARHQASGSADGAATEYRRLATPRRVEFDNELVHWRRVLRARRKEPRARRGR